MSFQRERTRAVLANAQAGAKWPVAIRSTTRGSSMHRFPALAWVGLAAAFPEPQHLSHERPEDHVKVRAVTA